MSASKSLKLRGVVSARELSVIPRAHDPCESDSWHACVSKLQIQMEHLYLCRRTARHPIAFRTERHGLETSGDLIVLASFRYARHRHTGHLQATFDGGKPGRSRVAARVGRFAVRC